MEYELVVQLGNKVKAGLTSLAKRRGQHEEKKG